MPGERTTLDNTPQMEIVQGISRDAFTLWRDGGNLLEQSIGSADLYTTVSGALNAVRLGWDIPKEVGIIDGVDILPGQIPGREALDVRCPTASINCRRMYSDTVEPQEVGMRIGVFTGDKCYTVSAYDQGDTVFYRVHESGFDEYGELTPAPKLFFVVRV